jgi:hypothetical protein
VAKILINNPFFIALAGRGLLFVFRIPRAMPLGWDILPLRGENPDFNRLH